MKIANRLKLLNYLLISIALLILVGCHVKHARHPTSVQEIKAEMNKSIITDYNLDQRRYSDSRMNRALMPTLSSYLNHKTAQKRFDVVANDLPAKEFFMGLVAGTSQNIMIHPEVTGLITLNLKNVTMREALDAARDLYGYEYRRASYGYEILPAQLQTRLFSVSYLDIQRTGRSFTQITTGQVSNVGTITTGSTSTGSGSSQNNSLVAPTGAPTSSIIETRSEMQFWNNLGKTIRNIIGTGEGRRVTINTQSGIVAVRAFPKELNNVYRFINQLQSRINRQVILEAKILEVRLNDEFQAGIDWSVLRNPLKNLDPNGLPGKAGIGQFSNQSFSNSTVGALKPVFAINLKGSITALIELLQEQGNVQVLSSPHVSTLNNQKAVIKVGTDAFYVTGVSTTNSVVGTSTLPSQDVSLTPFFSGITLDVTPEISNDDNITLHIHPSISTVTQQNKEILLGSTTTGSPNLLTLPLATSDIRETDTIVRAKNGQVVVIGGLMQNNMEEATVATPFVSKVPFLGSLFKRTRQVATKSELIILIRPVIANSQTTIDRLEKTNGGFHDLDKPFHAGGLPEVFGNEGERYESTASQTTMFGVGPNGNRVPYKDHVNV